MRAGLFLFIIMLKNSLNPFKIKDSTEGRVLFLPLVEHEKERVERKGGAMGCLFWEKW